MKQIKEVIPNFQDIQTMSIKPKSVISSAISEDAKSIIDSLFEQLKAIFSAWQQAWPTQEAFNRAKQEWTKAFAENDMTVKKVKFGLKVCRSMSSPFIPSSGQFINLCKPTPKSVNCPDYELAFIDAWMGNYKNPVVEATAIHVGKFKLRNDSSNDADLKKLFFETYELMINRHANGESLLNPINRAICNGAEKPRGLDAVNQAAEEAIEKRMKEQGISKNANEARAQALAMLGIRRKGNV